MTKKPRQLIPSNTIYDHFTLDINNNILYFIDDFFATYNLITNEWNCKCGNIEYNTEQATKINFDILGSNKSVHFPNPVNELHIMSNGKHMKYDNINNKFIELSQSKPPNSAVRHMIFMPKMKLLVLLLWNLEIWTCKITTTNQEIFTWKQSDWLLPVEYASMKRISQPMIAFDNLLVLFMSNDINGVDIWFFDMITNKRYRSDKRYPLNKTLTVCVKDEQDVLHCIGSGFYHRINLTEVLPTYQRNKLLVYGWVRLQEDDYDLYQQVPTSLTQLILNFYPSNL